jgi:hypothetical protein
MPLDCFRVLLGTPSWVDKIINFIIIRREWIFVKKNIGENRVAYEPQQFRKVSSSSEGHSGIYFEN